MKRTTLFKTIVLTAAMMLGGASSAWATAIEVVESYDFKLASSARGSDENYSLSGDALFQVNSKDMKLINDFEKLELNGRFASSNATGTKNNRMDYGLIARQNYISILNLKAGDKIYIECTDGWAFYDGSCLTENPVQGTKINATSYAGATYNVSNSVVGTTHLDLAGHNASTGAIKTIRIYTTKDIDMPTPSNTLSLDFTYKTTLSVSDETMSGVANYVTYDLYYLNAVSGASPYGFFATSKNSIKNTGGTGVRFDNSNSITAVVTNLQQGDEVTITFNSYSNESQGQITYATLTNVNTASIDDGVTLTPLVPETNIPSGTKIKVTGTGGYLSFRANRYTYFATITIKTSTGSTTETLTAPTIAAVASEPTTTKTVTITPGVAAHGSTVKTYYTTDGSTPTTASTLYTAPFDVDASAATKTVKAISIIDGLTNASDVTSEKVYGVELSAPKVALKSFTADANGAPSYPMTVTITKNGDTEQTLTYTFTKLDDTKVVSTITSGSDLDIDEPGTLSVTASGTGSVKSATTVDMPFAPAYIINYSRDFQALTDEEAGTLFSGWTRKTSDSWADWNQGTTGFVYYSGSNITLDSRLEVSSYHQMVVGFGVGRPSSTYNFTLGSCPESSILTLKTYKERGSKSTYNYRFYIPTSGNYTFSDQSNQELVQKVVLYEPVYTINVSAVDNLGYTFSSPVPLDFSGTSVRAYIAKYDKSTYGDVVKLTQVTKVPANTGVLIFSNSELTNQSIPVTSESTDDVTGNKMVAVSSAMTLSAASEGYENYVLAIEDDKAVFQLVKTNSASMSAGQAYLQIPKRTAGARSLRIVFDDETTGVADVRGKMEDVRGDFFNLQGQRVDTPKKGLYIVNGKKVIVK